MGWKVRAVFEAHNVPLEVPKLDEDGEPLEDELETNWSLLEGTSAWADVSHRMYEDRNGDYQKSAELKYKGPPAGKKKTTSRRRRK